MYTLTLQLQPEQMMHLSILLDIINSDETKDLINTLQAAINTEAPKHTLRINVTDPDDL